MLTQISTEENKAQYIAEHFNNYTTPKEKYSFNIKEYKNQSVQIHSITITSEDFIISGIDAILNIIAKHNREKAKSARK